jgi:hypothetical protein
VKENIMDSAAESGDPRRHTQRIRQELDELVGHLRDDVVKVNDPKTQALFETTAEVLTGLITAYEHAEEQSEPAWK